ncbi:unnamed protein product [Cylindrotheca closterium]|uniref:CRAL-TRIO domain-containing protein n=1 Tax=Cylindrotheca closterium TaxID=2856 RepID=A0AAD2GAZ8_9STRA|nr:unnamed protein product [Cylindrotheca closterium]
MPLLNSRSSTALNLSSSSSHSKKTLKNSKSSTFSLSSSSSSHSKTTLKSSKSSTFSVSSPNPRTTPSKKVSSFNFDQELHCLAKLNIVIKEDPVLSQTVDSELIYRFAYFHSFDYETALTALQQNYNSRYLTLSLTDKDLFAQFQKHTIFPLPDLKTQNKCNVFYTRPSRYTPANASNDDTRLIIDNLCYVLNDLSQTKKECRKGVALIANMNDWTMKNFSQDYCLQFMQALQGKMVPTKVELFLIVNPPSWFGRIWKVMKPMLSKSFSKKTHMIKEERLGEFLMEGYEHFLPDEITGGWKHTAEIVEDYVDLKRYEDEQKLLAIS